MDFNLSTHDERLLQRMRLSRLAEVMSELAAPLLHLDLNYILHIHCSELADAQAIADQSKVLREQVWLILGCDHIVVWQGWDAVAEWVGDFRAQSEDPLELVANELENPMPTATLEKTAAPKISKQSMALPGQTLSAIASDLEQDISTIREWFANRQVTVIPFAGEEIVSGEDAIAAYTYFEPMVIQARMAKRGLTPVTLNGASENGVVVTEAKPRTTRKTAAKPAAKTTTRKTAAKTPAAKKTTAKKAVAKKTA